MTYSYNVTGATKDEVKQKIAQEWDAIVATMPIHKADRAPAEAVAGAFIDALPDPTGKQGVNVYSYGSVGWQGDDKITSVSGSVQASLVDKKGV